MFWPERQFLAKNGETFRESSFFWHNFVPTAFSGGERGKCLIRYKVELRCRKTQERVGIFSDSALQCITLPGIENTIYAALVRGNYLPVVMPNVCLHLYSIWLRSPSLISGDGQVRVKAGLCSVTRAHGASKYCLIPTCNETRLHSS